MIKIGDKVWVDVDREDAVGVVIDVTADSVSVLITVNCAPLQVTPLTKWWISEHDFYEVTGEMTQDEVNDYVGATVSAAAEEGFVLDWGEVYEHVVRESEILASDD